MKKFLHTLFLFVVALAAHSQEPATPQLPVLNVTFDGAFTPYMDYVNGLATLTDTDGTVLTLPAKFKPRGATARSYMMKPSFNMKLRSQDYSEEQDTVLLNLRSASSWILDAMAIDRICMRNRVAFDLWNDFSRLPYQTEFSGRNGTVGRFVEVYVNSQYMGIYCLTDRINRKLLNLKKVKQLTDGTYLMRGVLYKSGTEDIADQNNPGYNDDFTACTVEWHNAWELTYPDEFASEALWQPLQEAYHQGRSTDYVKRHFHLDNLAEYQILIMALCIADNWGNKNRYFSIRNMNKDIDDPDPTESDRRRIVVTPWDLDTSFGGHYEGAFYDGNYNDWPVSAAQKNAPYPIDCLGADSEYLTLLRQKWLAARKGAFSVSSVKARLEGYRDLFLNSGAWQRMTDHFDSQSDKPMYVHDLTTEIAHIVSWYEQRFREMDAYFGVTDGIDDIAHNAQPNSSSTTVYNLHGQRIASSANTAVTPFKRTPDGSRIIIGRTAK